MSRARSIASTPGVIAPQPEQPLDPSLEALTRAGLTPAQAYQAQVYMNSPMAHYPPQPPPPDLPRLGVSLETDDGRLGLDFGANNGTPSEASTEGSSSDLLLSRRRSKPSSVHSRLSVASSYLPSPEMTTFPTISPSSRPYPLQVDTGMSSTSMGGSSSPASSTMVDPSSVGRRSSESSKTLPGPPQAIRKDRRGSNGDRSRSMSATMTPQYRALLEAGRVPAPRPPIPSAVTGRESPASTRGGNPSHRSRSPIMYPALLSRVAEAFKARIQLQDRVKDGLTYKDAFDGREAVDKIASIIKTTDRNLALLLGRALDAQKFFHAVTYDHRLRDSAHDLYQFRTKLPSPFVSGSVSADDAPLPSGVFTLLTDCYSPTCSRDQLCYSIACPRRMEQQARLNMKPQPGLKKQMSRESLGDLVEPGTLWIHSVPQEVVNSVSDTEKKRQEAINEVIYTERDFVRDMEYLRDLWIKPLTELEIIPEARRKGFVEQVFWNILDIIAVNTRLRDALNKRQKSYVVVDQIGDVLLEAVPHFGPFVSYGAHQLYGKFEFEKEKASNPAFAQFVEEVERRPESRKLELNGYLTKPTTRLARYPLLLEAVLKHTPEDNPDKTVLPKVVEMVREFLKAVNHETGKAENRFNLLQLHQQLIFRDEERVDLRLKEEGRELVYKGALKKHGDSSELQVFLFDHALLVAKAKIKTEQYKVYRKPIPLELLIVLAPDEFPSGKPHKDREKQKLLKNAPHAPVIPVKDTKGFSITFVHLGRKYYQITLYASTYVSQRKWVEQIQKQQDVMRERSTFFETVTLSEGFFVGVNRVNCAAPYNNGRRAVYGTDDGVYLSDLFERNREPVKVLGLKDVSQVDVLEEYQLLIVLSERQVITFPLDALDPMDPMAGLKRAKRIASHISFFKTGMCLGKTLVCVVKASPLSSTIKALEPIDQNVRGRNKPTFRKLLQGGNDTLRVFKEFYIPVQSSSIHFLKTRLCVGCANGFEIVDLETLDTQGLIDPADLSLDFVRKKENLKPLAIYRIDNEFLLCYDEFAFYVNKVGWRSRKDFMVFWEGYPTGFALHYPYVLAFEPTFVEIRHVETGSLAQIIQGNNLRCLFADTPPSTTNSASQFQYSPYQQGYGLNTYSPSPPGPYGGGRSSMGNGYVPGSPQSPYSNAYQPRPQSTVGRDEIIMVSDDRIMRLQLATPPHNQ
ncbi:CNH-domain-containing protein [Wolfiporia cocos MD-104 SS10]|uniref:CNH-domain-containing protein n=1 Tax=Wolfiporia cocos (strain MD-104) TaxID=742152 RepID=A0A2H3J3Y2_WOLCO|nr:CNH-domain-containing protein [Wolfiporia cocos MD-104 SS10]